MPESKSDGYLCNCVSNLASYIWMIYEARLKCQLSNWKKEYIEVSCNNRLLFPLEMWFWSFASWRLDFKICLWCFVISIVFQRGETLSNNILFTICEQHFDTVTVSPLALYSVSGQSPGCCHLAQWRHSNSALPHKPALKPGQSSLCCFCLI